MADLTVALKLRADRTGLVGGIELTKEDLRQLGVTAEQTSAKSSRAFTGMGNSLKSIRDHAFSLRGALAAIGLEQLASGVIRTADTYASLEGRLKLVTSGSADLAAVQQKLFEVAQQTGVSYEETASLYGKVAKSASELGLSQQQLLKFTTITNQAIQVSGATAAEASGSVRQLGQALASGALRGDEFNSIAEGMPRLRDAIAAGLGISIGKLREFAAEGKLTAEVVTKALLSQGDVIESEFKKMPITVGRAMTEMENTVKRAIAGANTGPLVDSIRNLTTTLSDPAVVQGMQSIAQGLVSLAGLAAKAAGAFGNLGTSIGEALARASGFTVPDEELRRLQQLREEAERFGDMSLAAARVQEIDRLVERFPELRETVARDVVGAAADVLGFARGLTQAADAADSVSAPLKRAAEGMIPFRTGLDASKTATIELTDEGKKANEAAEKQIKVLERTLALTKTGLSIDEASTRAKLELDNVNVASIGRLVSLQKQTDELRKSQKEAAKEDKVAVAIALEIADARDAQAKAEIDARNAAIARQDALRPELEDLRAVVEMTQQGADVEVARYEIQLQRLEISRAQLVADGKSLEAKNVEMEIDKLRLQRQLQDIGETRDAERAALKQIADDAQKAADQINEALTDSLFRAFEDGDDFGKAFFRSLVATAKTIVLRPGIEFLVQPLSQMVSSIFSGAGGAASGTGGAGGLLGMLGLGGGAGSLLDKIIVSGDSVDRLMAGQFSGANLAGALPAAGAVAGAGYGLYQIGSSLARSDSAISGSTQGLANLLTFGNSSVLSGLDNLAGGNIFGTKWKTSDAGLVLDYMGGDLEAQTFERQKKKRSLGRGTKRRTQYDDLDDGAESAIEAEFDAFLSSLSTVADQLNLNADAVDNYTASLRISTKGLNPEEAQKAVADALRAEFSVLTDQVIPFLAEFALQGEETADTLLRVGGNLQVVNASLKTLGLTLDGISGQSLVEITEGLVDLFGGDSGALAAAAGAFYDAFTPEAVKFADLGRALAEQLFDVNLALPATRGEFADLRKGLDLTSEDGREALATLLRLTNQANTYYGELERQAAAAAEAQVQIGADALSAQSDALKGSADEFDNAVDAFRDGFQDISDALKATLASIVSVRGGIAQSALAIRRTAPDFSSLDYQKGLIGDLRGRLNSGSLDDRVETVDKLQQAIAQRYQLEFEAINKARQSDAERYNAQLQQADAMRQALQNLKGFVDGLKLSDLSILRPGEQLAEAKAQYGRALMAAQSGTDPAAVQNLQGAAQTYLERARGYFGSDERYQDIFKSTLAETERVGGRSVSVLPPNTGFYDQAISEAQNTALDELDALQEQLDELQEQANELFIDSFATLNATLQAQTDAITATMEATTQAVMDRVGGAVDAAAQEAKQAAQLAIATTQRTAADVRAELRAVGFQIASSVASAVSSVASTRNVA